MRRAACRWCINIYCSTRFYEAMVPDQFGALGSSTGCIRNGKKSQAVDVNFGKIPTLNN